MKPTKEYNGRSRIMKKHIIFTYKGITYSSYKAWSFKRCEEVMIRLGAEYWEVGINDPN